MYRMNTIQAKGIKAKANRAKGKATSLHSMHLRSYTLPPPCTLIPPVLPIVDYGYHIKPQIKRIKRRSNVCIRNVSDSLANLTIVRKRANSTSSISSISSECTQPKRKRIRLMEEVETPIQSIQPQWPECMTDAELVGLLQMPIVYTLPTGVEESNRDRFIHKEY